MTVSLVIFCVWALAANLAAMLPSKDNHWTCACVLIALGIPLAGWVTYQNGPLVGMLCLAAGVSLLRWPAIHLWRWARRRRRADG